MGAGGLGSPVLLYLAAAGVGHVRIVDGDRVELSNLHRQVIHTQEAVGARKELSAQAAVGRLNDRTRTSVHGRLTPENAVRIVRGCDLVVDCSDNAPTRYLVNDACVVAGVPLVSAAAVGLEGQLTVYNYRGGPCYRCLFPRPPQPQHCQRCSEAGVLGVVPGVMGTLQALEAIKVLTGKGDVLSRRLLLFDALAGKFREMKLRGRQEGCAACRADPSVLEATVASTSYAAQCGGAMDDAVPALALLGREHRVACEDYFRLRRELWADGLPYASASTQLIDVRPAREFAFCALADSTNIPLDELPDRVPELKDLKRRGDAAGQPHQVFVVCRRGNDSQRAVELLRREGLDAKDLIGGLAGWREAVDASFPHY